jgi:hypothetical protein
MENLSLDVVSLRDRAIIIRTGGSNERTMQVDLADLKAFVAVAHVKGFRDGAHAIGARASGILRINGLQFKRDAEFFRHQGFHGDYYGSRFHTVIGMSPFFLGMPK